MVTGPGDRRRVSEQDFDSEDEAPYDPWALPVAPMNEPVAQGAISVVLDDRGAVPDVVVSRRWRDSVHPRDLGQALLDATNKAIVASRRAAGLGQSA